MGDESGVQHATKTEANLIKKTICDYKNLSQGKISEHRKRV